MTATTSKLSFWMQCLTSNYDLADFAVSVGEIARLFKRDVSNIRYSMKSLERQKEIIFLGLRKTPSGRLEKRYAERQSLEEFREEERIRFGVSVN